MGGGGKLKFNRGSIEKKCMHDNCGEGESTEEMYT